MQNNKELALTELSAANNRAEVVYKGVSRYIFVKHLPMPVKSDKKQ